MRKSTRSLFLTSIGVLFGIFLAILIKGLWTGNVEWDRLVSLVIGSIIGLFVLYFLINSSHHEDEEQ